MPIARPVSSAASASRIGQVAAAHRERLRAPPARWRRWRRGRTRAPCAATTSAPTSAAGRRPAARAPAARSLPTGTRGATPPSVSSSIEHARIERRVAICMRASALCCVASARPENAPQRQQAGDLLHRARREVRAVRARARSDLRRPADQRQALARLVHPRGERGSVPREAGVRRLHRLVGAMIEAPLQVERRGRVPVALAERVGEAALHGAGGVAGRRGRSPAAASSTRRRPSRGGRQRRRATLAARRRPLSGSSRCGSSARSGSTVRSASSAARTRPRPAEVAGQRQRVRRVARAVHEPHVEVALARRCPGWRTLPRFMRTKSVSTRRRSSPQ